MFMSPSTPAPWTLVPARPPPRAAATPIPALRRIVSQAAGGAVEQQDPMNPLDNAQMTSQMAQINTVTGIQQLNLTMVSMAEQFASMHAMQGTMLLRRSVQVEGDNLAVEKAEDGSVTGKGAFELSNAASNVKVDILSPGGQVVGSVELGARARHAPVTWDASKCAGDSSSLRFRVTAQQQKKVRWKAAATLQSKWLAPAWKRVCSRSTSPRAPASNTATYAWSKPTPAPALFFRHSHRSRSTPWVSTRTLRPERRQQEPGRDWPQHCQLRHRRLQGLAHQICQHGGQRHGHGARQQQRHWRTSGCDCPAIHPGGITLSQATAWT